MAQATDGHAPSHQRPQAVGPDDGNLIKVLQPHIERAYRLQSALAVAHGQGTALETALDALRTGLILLGPKAKVVFMNRAAKHMLGAKNGLLLNRETIHAEHSAESARLEKLMAGAVASASHAGGAISISRRDLPPLLVLTAPIHGLNGDLQQPVRAVLFITDPTQRVRPTSNILRALFRLTPAECRVAMLLADGYAPNEIANIVGVRKNTLKSHLASIYRKTGTARQSQLVRLLLQIVTPRDGRGE